MTIDEFTTRTGISPVEAYFRWKDILHDYLADVNEHKNAFCLRWLLEQGRDAKHCLCWLAENDPQNDTGWQD